MVERNRGESSRAYRVRGMKATSTILGIASALPARIVTNEELAQSHPTWDIHRVAAKTGVRERRWATSDETSLDLGERAAADLVGRFGHDEIDALLFCTQTPDHPMPPNSSLLQDRLGLSPRSAALDFTLACSGYVYGLWIADSLVRSGAARRVLLVTAETYSKLIHPEDRGPMTLFGDGGAATLIGVGDGRIGLFELGTDGANADAFQVAAGGARLPRDADTSRIRADEQGGCRSLEHLHMQGTKVLDFVKREIPGCVRRLLQKEGLVLDDIAMVVSHQASRMSLEYLQRALKIPSEKMCDYMERIGNTVSASIPLALEQAVGEGRIRHGDRVLLVGFGVGLSWGATIVTWGAS
jgi:3-oxoacyl-[acyl-carrier-protein] synthase III